MDTNSNNNNNSSEDNNNSENTTGRTRIPMSRRYRQAANWMESQYGGLFYYDKRWYQYINGVYVHVPNSIEKEIAAYTVDQEFYSPTNVNAVDKLLQYSHQIELTPRSDDAHGRLPVYIGNDPNFPDPDNIINFKNCLLDISGDPRVIEHTPDFISIVQLPYRYDPDAQCPQWHDFMKSCFNNSENIDPSTGLDYRILKSQEWYGYLLTTDNSLQKALFLWGAAGAGKGVFSRMAARLVGKQNSASPDITDLAKNFTWKSLDGKLLAIISELHTLAGGDAGKTLKREIHKNILKIIGGDDFAMEEKGLQVHRWGPLICRLMFSSNKPIRLNDESDAIMRRLEALFFEISHRMKADPNLEKKLTKELSGILNWALQGLARLREAGGKFTQCPLSNAKMFEHRKSIDPTIQFIEDHCVVTPEVQRQADCFKDCLTVEGQLEIPLPELYQCYVAWVMREEQDGIFKLNQNQFKDKLTSLSTIIGDKRKNVPGSGCNQKMRVMTGIGLKMDHVIKPAKIPK